MDPETRKALKQARYENEEKFEKAVNDLKAQRKDDIEDLAKTYNKKSDQVCAILNAESVYKRERAITLHNAKTHWVAAKFSDKSLGNQATLDNLYANISERPEIKDPTPELAAKMINKLKEHRETKKGARINNCAANHDYQYTMNRINTEVCL